MTTKILLMFSAMALFTTMAMCQPGMPDLEFDVDGRLTTAIGAGDDFCSAVAVQPDGKILAVGTITDIPAVDFAIVRYNINGTPDSTFDADGIAVTDFGDWDEATSVAIQADGKIVVAGTAFNGSTFEFAVVRYNANGTLDNSFGTAGKLTTDVGFGDDFAQAVVIQSDGKIIASGASDAGSGSGDFAVVRYSATGTPDGSFGSGGVVITDFAVGDAANYGMAIQGDGKIVLTGALNTGSDLDFVTVRYNSDGSTDMTFSGSGIVVTAVGASSDIANEVLIQPDGKIVAVGFSVNGVDADVALVRYNSDGTLDTSFDLDGMAIYDSGTGDDGAYGATLQADGKIVVVGSKDGGAEPDFAMLRYKVDGTLDSTFGLNGLVITDFGAYAQARSVAMDPIGKIVVGGTVTDTGNDDFAVARYHSGLNIGIVELLKDDAAMVFPNPVDDETVLEYTLINNEQISIDLYDVSGKLVLPLVDNAQRSSGLHKESLNLNGIPTGNYILKMTGTKGSVSIRILKN